MRPSRSLRSLRNTGLKRLVYLHRLATATPQQAAVRDRFTSFVVLELFTVWSNYGRAFYMSCATGTNTANGRPVPCGVGQLTPNDALTLAIATDNPKLARQKGPWFPRDEPNWDDPSVVQKALTALSTPAEAWYSSATGGFSTPVMTDLKIFRNFYAHRGEVSGQKTRKRAVKYAVPPDHPTVILNTRVPGRPQSIVADWASDLQNVMSLMPK